MVKLNTRIFLFSLFIYIFLFSSCRKLFCDPDDELHIDQTSIPTLSLKTNGYYYEESNDLIRILFLYKNGILRHRGSSEDSTLLLKPPTFSDQTNWGIVEIQESKISFEKWYPSSGCGAPAFVSAGEILNDSTFHISRSFRIQDGEETEVNEEEDETYHFVKFSPKPDSTNTFIK